MEEVEGELPELKKLSLTSNAMSIEISSYKTKEL